MYIFSKKTNFDFVGVRYFALALSVLMLVVSIYSIATKGLNFGIDFTGGTMIEVGYEQPANLTQIRETLEAAGYENALVQNFGSSRDVLIRLPVMEGANMADISNQVVQDLQTVEDEAISLRRVEFVGPQVGAELAEDGSLAMLYAMIGILIYVAVRFEYRFAISSVLGLIHDVIITVGIFSLFQIDFDLTVLAGILAIIGYSLNDTIVIFDRIRENFIKLRKGTPPEIVNTSINDTLGRTVITSVTTLIVVLALLFFGGEAVYNFALVLSIGIVVGVYSSVYIAGTAVLLMGVTKTDLMPPEKDKDADANPDGAQV